STRHARGLIVCGFLTAPSFKILIMSNATSGKYALLTTLLLFAATSFPCATAQSTAPFEVGIIDGPRTFTNPFTITTGSERSRRSGEPVVVLHHDTYYLFITGGGGGYWISDNFRDWEYVDAP